MISPRFFAALALSTVAGWSAHGQSAVNIQLVNDTGLPDSNFYVRTVGQTPSNTITNGNPPMTPTNVYTAIGETNAAAATAIPLNTLPTNASFTSTVTGHTVVPYNTEWYNVTSGQMYFQYSTNASQAFVYTNGLQPSTLPGGAQFRFDFAEATVLPNANNAMDVTYVEKFGFPMKIEWFRPDGTLVNAAYCHANTTTIAAAFEALGLSPAVFGVSTNAGATNLVNWNTTNGNLTNFARIITPYKTSPASFTFPYPSMSRYLDSLVAAGTTYQLNSSGYFSSTNGGDTNNRYFVGYDLTLTTNSPATNDPNNPPGWLVTMTYNSNNVPAAPNYYSPTQLNPATNFSAIQYTNTLSYIIPYAAGTYTVASAPGVPPGMARDGVPLNNTNAWSVELWMAGNVNTALNLGYFGGVPSIGTNMVNWFLVGNPGDIPRPFAGARTTNTTGNDGFYNLYMSLLYQYTDFYGFTYGERYTPAVLFTPQPGDTVRFTILPDERLESPIVTVNDISTNGAILSWPASTNAAGYRIDTLQPLNVPPITNIASTASNYAFTNLAAGTPYVFEVRSTNTANGNPIESAARPVSVTTAGSFPTTAVSNAATLIAFPIDNGLDSFQRIQSVTVNGTNYPLASDHIHFYAPGGTPVMLPANLGTNQYTVAAYDGNSNVIYYNWLSFVLGQSTINTNNYALSDAEIYGLAGRFPVPGLFGTNADTNSGFTTQNFPASATNAGAQIGVSLVTGGAFQTTPTIPDVVAGGSNNYAQWISSYYKASDYPEDQPDEDPDGDLANNLLEYSRGTDPSTFNSAPDVSLTAATNTGLLTYSFAQTVTNELKTIVSWSPDMTNWNYTGLTATNASYQMDLGTNSKVFFNTDVFLP